MQAAPPAQVFAALADVYGLRVKVEEDATHRLTRRLWRAASSVADVPAAVRGSVPEPLLRALHDGASGALASGQMPAGESAKERAERHKKAFLEQQRLWMAPTLLAIEAARRLRLAVQPELDKAGDGARVPVATLSEADRSAFAITLVAGSLPGLIRGLRQQLPGYITGFDQAYLTGGP